MQHINVQKLDAERIARIFKAVEEKQNHEFSESELENIVRFTIRKCELGGKNEEYFYLLLADEVKWRAVGAQVNRQAAQNRCNPLAASNKK